MVAVEGSSALWADPSADLEVPGPRPLRTADGAQLTGGIESSTNGYLSAVPAGLVFQLPPELIPAGIGNGSRQLVVLYHVPGCQILNTDDAVFPNQLRGQLMQHVLSLVGDTFVEPSHLKPCFLQNLDVGPHTFARVALVTVPLAFETRVSWLLASFDSSEEVLVGCIQAAQCRLQSNGIGLFQPLQGGFQLRQVFSAVIVVEGFHGLFVALFTQRQVVVEYIPAAAERPTDLSLLRQVGVDSELAAVLHG